MPRRARLTPSGLPVHLVQRGNDRKACFHSDSDRHVYLEHLFDAADKFQVAVHAWCLMTNHVHLLATPSRPEGPSLLMKRLGQMYVQYINRTYQRTGTLWEGRFRSCIVQAESHLIACHRYIEMNPVRAGMVSHPAEYSWSSHRQNAYGEAAPRLTPHLLYLELGADDRTRQARYRQLFENSLSAEAIAEIRNATCSGLVLGSESFREDIARASGQRTVSGKSGRPRKRDDATEVQSTLELD